MIPIADELPRQRLPAVTWSVIGINVVAFLYELLLGSNIDQFFLEWGAVPAYISNPFDYPFYSVTLLTSMFLHGGWSHILGNMLYLWIFGDNIEDILGPWWFGAFYLGAGIVAGLAQVIVNPFSEIPAIGASGAVAGVLGIYLVLFPTAPVRVLVPGFFFMRVARLPALIVLGFWFVLQLFNGFLSLGSMHLGGGVAWFAHIGGFVAGLVVGFVARNVLRRRQQKQSLY
ncbi:MAG: rhomboid family intramembrane serine protease [Anaerolineae bacterium]|nr:rhomboid family intramembrane serine protease [Anaerolineae bacterium]